MVFLNIKLKKIELKLKIQIKILKKLIFWSNLSILLK